MQMSEILYNKTSRESAYAAYSLMLISIVESSQLRTHTDCLDSLWSNLICYESQIFQSAFIS